MNAGPASALGLRHGLRPGLEFTAAQGAVAVAVSIAGGVAVAFAGDPLIVATLVVGAGFVAVGMLAPALFLSLLLLVRPMLDELTRSTVGGLPSANAAGAVAVVLVGVAAIMVSRTPRFGDPRVSFALVAVLAISALASVQAFFQFGGAVGVEPLVELTRLGALLAVYLLSGQLFGSDQGVRRLVLVVIASAMMPTALGLIELSKGPEAVEGYDLARISGSFVGPVPFSSFLAVVALILTQLPRQTLDRGIRLFALAAVLAALVATYSREGWLIFLLGLAILEWRRNRGALIAALMVCALLIVAIPNVRERTLPFGGDAESRTADESFNWRIANWKGLLDRYEEQPLIGWGLGSTGYVNPRRPIRAEGAGGGYEAHNTAVRALVEGGPLLLAAYVLMFGVIIASVRRAGRDRDWSLHYLARTLLAIWIGVAAIAVISDDPTEATAMMYLLLALTGAMQVAHSRWRESESFAQGDHQAPSGGLTSTA